MKERTRELSVETVKSALIVLHRLSKHARVNARQTKLFSSHSFMVITRHPRRQNFSRLFEKFCKNSKKFIFTILLVLLCIEQCIAIFIIITRAS